MLCISPYPPHNAILSAGANGRLSLGVFVLLFGVWYCYKRGREERKKLESNSKESLPPEILVEGAKPQSGDAVDHGDGIRTPQEGFQSISVIHDVPRPMVSEEDISDTPLQVESEPIPAEAKRGRKSWFKGK